MNNFPFKNELRKYALDIGFCEIGFAEAKPLELEFERYLKWLEKGYNGSMDYLERNLEKRRNPDLILPGAKTIIVCAYNYNSPFHHNGRFKISRYAWGDDYHEIVLSLLKKVEAKLNELFPEARCKSYVDTGSILEKSWAVRAGIGWQGKNSLLLTKRFGSYVFLGIILTTIEFEPDPVLPDYCGKCNKCIENCPTGAIVEPMVVDSNSCISYWTIEAKPEQDIPKEIDLKGWIFGCDICQEVCPWNTKKQYTNNYRFYPRNGETNLEVGFLSTMTEATYRVRFKNSPVKRAKFLGLKRNFEHIVEYENAAQ